VVYLLIFTLFSCKKQDEFLNASPNNHLAIPNTLTDLQLMLQNEAVFNSSDPNQGILSADEYFASSSIFGSAPKWNQNSYLWAKDIYPNQPGVSNWNTIYSAVYLANSVLDALGTITVKAEDQPSADAIKGAALFYRSWAFFNLVQLFSVPYDSTTAATDLGIALRLTADVNAKSVRASVKDCYAQILQDGQTALALLPATSSHITQPSKIVANGFLARVYLSIGNYPQALKYSDGFLKLFNTLTDYNTLIPGSYPIANTYLSEDIFHCSAQPAYLISSLRNTLMDSVVMKTYDANDLRLTCLFRKATLGYAFGGTYDVTQVYFFSGIATDEMYLTRAEANARLNNLPDAVSDLNTLLRSRWKTGTYTDYSSSDADQVLAKVLLERRKELIFRGTRWMDLRRLNKDARFAVTIHRTMNGTSYDLPPNDPRYALPIPDDEIQLSGIQQNPR
jgi:hypothetical protein